MPLFPASEPRPTSSEAERLFFRALLTGLPKDWTAWHSLRLRAGPALEGEGDFVLLALMDLCLTTRSDNGAAPTVVRAIYFRLQTGARLWQQRRQYALADPRAIRATLA